MSLTTSQSCIYQFHLCLIFIPMGPTASEIQMMALPHAQYVIAEASTPVSGVNGNQVKTVSIDEYKLILNKQNYKVEM